MRPILLGIIVLLAGCGSSPSIAPRPTPVPNPIYRADLKAIPSEATWRSTAEGWAIGGQAENSGQGCAANVRGTATITDKAGAVLQTITGPVVSSQRIVLAGERFPVESCCATEQTYQHSDQGTVTLALTWDAVSCPKF